MPLFLDEAAEDDEQLMHTVYVDAFYMDTHEVTNTDYQKFVLANPEWQKDQIAGALHDGDSLAHWNGNNSRREKTKRLKI